MPFKTHFDFQSKVSDIQSAEDIDNKINYALDYQFMFERTTTLWEMLTWNYEKLQEITINVEEIDRLYHIFCYEDDCKSEFSLIARMSYKNDEFLYVYLEASCAFYGFENYGSGTILVSKYPEFFVNNLSHTDVINFILEECYKSSSSIFYIPLKTHLSFKSFNGSIKNAIDIYSKIAGALYYQDRFERKTTTKEIDNWDYKELQKIKIDVERIDRLYHIFFDRDCDGPEFQLVARMDSTPLLYVELISFGENGTILISKNRNFFSDEIIRKNRKIFSDETFLQKISFTKYILNDD